MKTKGVMADLKSIIIAVFVGLLLFAIGYEIYGQLEVTGDREVCRLSVMAKTATKGFAGTESAVIKELKCKTHNVQVKGNGIFKNGKRIHDLDLSGLDDLEKREKAEGTITKAIADEMYDCWYQFREQDPFGQYNQNLRCVQCSTITFSDEVLSQIQVLPDFVDHLAEYKDDQGTTYLEYLSGNMIGEFEEGSIPAHLSIERPLSVIYETSKNNNLIKAATFGFAGYAEDQKIGSRIRASLDVSIPAAALALRRGASVAQAAGTTGSEAAAVYAVGMGESGLAVDTTFGFVLKEGFQEIVWNGKNFVSTTSGKVITPAQLTELSKTMEIATMTPKAGAGVKMETAIAKQFFSGAAQAQKAGRLASFMSKTGPKLLGIASKVAWIATVAIVTYDIMDPEEQLLSGVEIVPTEDTGLCDQFY